MLRPPQALCSYEPVRLHGPTSLGITGCRIRTRIVGQVDGETATVRSRPLEWDGSGLSVGAPRSEIVRWSSDGRSLIDRPMPGDRVALHWDWICDTITEEQYALIESHEQAYRRRPDA